ncbi:CATRA conflict system CASPASE/TPR repeat-associated protein, partial [Streptomyces sp. NPDC013489]|uniref:CATRA conflict system CASPASE/TPR repeat-associated protein n=1 Tax=Streptomyces sp. NPDC013489 TaxID=3155606 RepID=UPI0033E18FAC
MSPAPGAGTESGAGAGPGAEAGAGAEAGSGAGSEAVVGAVEEPRLIVHLYAPCEGPDAAAAYAGLRGIWSAARSLFRMDRPIPGADLPHDLPEEPPGPAPRTAGGPAEEPLAAQECPDEGFQTILRRHHDVLVLSAALAPGAMRAPGGASAGPPSRPVPPDPVGLPWAPGPDRLDALWDAVSGGRTGALLGGARLHLCRAAPGQAPVPPGADVVALDRGVTLWEPGPGDDARAERRLHLAADTADDDLLSAWTWSRGDLALPRLARYLLHAAKLRYELRVFERDTGGARLPDVDPGPPDDRPGALDRTAGLLARRRAAAAALAISLRELHRTGAIAAANMAETLRDREAMVLAGAGPFADDRQLADWFLARVDDEAHYLELAASQAEQDLALLPPPAVPPPDPFPTPAGPARSMSDPHPNRSEPPRTVSHPHPHPHPSRSRSEASRSAPAPAGAPSAGGQEPADGDVARTVFVVHGRDDQARDAVFTFLRALDLRPLEWETLVAGTGSAAPYLGEVIGHAVRRAQATLVLMTPDDVVNLHPGLGGDDGDGTGTGLQARPNVLLELGMALAAYPDRTVIVKAGDQREVTDLGGRNFIRLDAGPACRRKIADRLRSAGCRVDDTGQDWLAPGLFAALDAYGRTLPVPDPP